MKGITKSIVISVTVFIFSFAYVHAADEIKSAVGSMLAGCNFYYRYHLEKAEYFIGFDKAGESPYVIVSLCNLKGYKAEIPMLVAIKKSDNGNFLIQKVIITQEELINPAEKEGYLAGKNTYLKQFVNKNTGDEFKMRKDLDAITGASPTSWFIAHTAGVQAKHIEQIYNNKELLKKALENKKSIELLDIY